MKPADRTNLAAAYEHAWVAVKGLPCVVEVGTLGWFTIKHKTGSTLTSQRVRADKLLAGLATLTGRLAKEKQ